MIPCEFMVNELLPTIRRQTSLYLSSKKYSQKQIAQILGISEAAVSQYISKKRGKQVSLLEREIKGFIQKNYDLEKTFSENVCYICTYIRNSNLICKYHRLVDDFPSEICKGCKI
jgi:predicted transcriptional regulator